VAEVQERLLDAWSRLAPDDADAGVLRAELFTRRGDVEGADASIADAIRAVETGRASTHRPHWARAARHFGSKRWQEAINDAESAAAHLDGASPEDAREVLFLLSRARRRVRAWESAEMAIDALRRRVAPTPSLHCELGWLRHDEQRYVEALDEVRRALDVSNGPDPAVARDLVALMCALEKHGVRTLSTGPRPARPERAIRPKRKFKEARA
jgi:thioredoxin-like negative regulator of GroEL